MQLFTDHDCCAVDFNRLGTNPLVGGGPDAVGERLNQRDDAPAAGMSGPAGIALVRGWFCRLRWSGKRW